jgi:hypothetical protein
LLGSRRVRVTRGRVGVNRGNIIIIDGSILTRKRDIRSWIEPRGERPEIDRSIKTISTSIMASSSRRAIG